MTSLGTLGTLGTLIRGSTNRLVEGSPAEIEAYKQRLVRERRLALARAYRGWREFDVDTLRPRRGGRFLETEDGDLLQRRPQSPFASRMVDGDVRVEIWQEDGIVGFYVTAGGDPVVLERAPMSKLQLDMVEYRRRAREGEQRTAKLEQAIELREFRKLQPRRAVTFADVEGREMPTVAQAAKQIQELGGTLSVAAGRLVIERPEKFTPKGGVPEEELVAEFLDAVRVVVAAGEIVVKAVESGSQKPLTDRLPDKPVGAGGGVAA